MRIAVIGGGPGGLFFAGLVRRRDPSCHVDVFERNESGTTYGFGVVFSDETLEAIAAADEQVHSDMANRFVTWQDIDIHYKPTVDSKSSLLTSTGHAFAAMSRVELLGLLSKRCLDLGVNLHYGTEAPGLDELRADYDLVVGADGVRSPTRAALAEHLRPSLDVRHNRYIWLGTDKIFESFTFDVRATEHGVMQLHAYPFGAGSTAIVEMREDVWRRANPSIADCSEIFAERLDGNPLHGKGTDWIDFATVRCSKWSLGNVVLLGDAVHTAHFSIGSGTKLAMEDAAALAAAVTSDEELEPALRAFEALRRPIVESTQRAAQASLEWFEDLDRYLVQEPTRFGFNLLTRSRRITYDNLRLRDPEYIAKVDEWFARSEVARGAMPGPATVRPPMFQPFHIGPLSLKNRIIVSPMDMYSATDGVPGDFHLVHLGSKALGGAGLVMTEMVC
ncbi:MAG: FAD-dependent monooxygenase, partial [Stackebrandtia sp.]